MHVFFFLKLVLVELLISSCTTFIFMQTPMFHLQETEGDDQTSSKLHTCPHCNRSFKGLNYFRFHVKGHLGKSSVYALYNFVCETLSKICNKKKAVVVFVGQKISLFLQVISLLSAHFAKRSFWLVTYWRNTWKFMLVRGDISVVSVASYTKLLDMYVNTWEHTQMKDPTTAPDATKDTKPRWFGCFLPILFENTSVCWIEHSHFI